MRLKIIKSAKRQKTIQAKQVGDIIEVRAPANISDSDLQPHIDKLVARLSRRSEKAELDDAELHRRAQRLNRAYFDGALRWTSIRWVTNQNGRHGSCTPSNATIRISHRLTTMPRFVLDYVIVHELAHLLEANHGPNFWALVERYPRTERARGYLMAVGLEKLDEGGDE